MGIIILGLILFFFGWTRFSSEFMLGGAILIAFGCYRWSTKDQKPTVTSENGSDGKLNLLKFKSKHVDVSIEFLDKNKYTLVVQEGSQPSKSTSVYYFGDTELVFIATEIKKPKVFYASDNDSYKKTGWSRIRFYYSYPGSNGSDICSVDCRSEVAISLKKYWEIAERRINERKSELQLVKKEENDRIREAGLLKARQSYAQVLSNSQLLGDYVYWDYVPNTGEITTLLVADKSGKGYIQVEGKESWTGVFVGTTATISDVVQVDAADKKAILELQLTDPEFEKTNLQIRRYKINFDQKDLAVEWAERINILARIG